ncbi:MAG TPA: hypothetical protein VGO76_17575 [Luteibacter sp.]|jgi:hypothetical protein|nr:hypothetical protein [Luteibacter sp.]
MRNLIVSLLLAGLPNLGNAVPMFYVNVINDALTDVEQVVSAESGSGRWIRHYLDERPFRAGSATTLGLARSGSCLRDLRFEFSDGRTMTVHDFDICRARSLHLGEALARAR